ncbi:MAG: TonB-dependent receptor [Bacteroidaceae bacterium]|nr:TonB-dependent receptor [Bacteroidaceae bacterium]
MIPITMRLSAQTCTVSGIISDSEDKIALPGANISYSISGEKKVCVANDKGFYTFSMPRGTNTTVKVTYMGFTPTTRVVIANKKQLHLDIELTPNESELSEVVVRSRVPLVTQRGDTTVYFASSYKVHADATAYDLLSQKLPGVGMKDGKLMAHGEEVKSIEIDGREYFRGDVNMALRNLPAHVISEIQIYDKLSDYAELSGFNDGNTQKTINIRTRQGTAHSHFGKATAGAGVKNMYKLYGMYNWFNDDQRWSLFTQWNNINEQNFSMIDLLSVTGTASTSAPSQSPYAKGSNTNNFHPTTSDDISSMMVDVSDYGITTSRAAGTNYSDEWDKGKMKFSGHYLYNNSDNHTRYDIYDSYFGATASNNLQAQTVDNTNLNHRFNAKYEFRIDSLNYILLRPALAYQGKDELSNITAWTVTATDTAHLLQQMTNTDQSVLSTSGEAMFMHRFGRSGHVITADARVSYMRTDEDIYMDFSNVQSGEAAQQNTGVINKQRSFTYMLSYIHALGRHHRLKLDIGWSKTLGMMRRRTDMMTAGSSVYSTDSLLSGSTWSNFGGWQANMAWLMNMGEVNMVAGIEVQRYNLYNSNDLYYLKRNYITPLPYLFLRYHFNRSQLHVQYKASHKYPGLAQVHDVINNSNATMAIRGSLWLEPAYHHNLTSRLVMPISSTGAVFVFFNNLEQSDNYIGSLRSLSSESFQGEGERRNTQILSYQNTDGFFSWTSLVAYGFPLSLASSNVNLSSMVKYTKTPGYWDNHKQFTEQWNWSANATMGSNISEDVDFVVDINTVYNSSANMTFDNMNVNYWSLSYGAQLNWQFVPQLKLVLECGRTNYFGSGTSQFNATISNIALAYKCMKDKRGELRFSLHDMLDQDNSFYQTTTELYRREVTTNILGRYAMLSFTYNLNTNH